MQTGEGGGLEDPHVFGDGEGKWGFSLHVVRYYCQLRVPKEICSRFRKFAARHLLRGILWVGR